MLPNIYLLLPILFLTLIGSVFIVNLIFPIKLDDVKYKSIDGLRGYLAFFVFLHHSYIYYFYLKTNIWEEPKSNLFNHFGQTSVLFFFMITSFLFTNKLINAKEKKINWNRFFISRIFRLFPMYFISMILLFVIVSYESHFILNDKISHIIRDSFKWILFTIGGTPDINLVKNTNLINAGVSWSLPFEWFFYLFLPILALLFRIKVSNKILIITSIILFYILHENHPDYYLFLPFLSGIIASFIYKINNYNATYSKGIFSVIIIMLFSISIYFFNSGRNIIPIIIATIIFILITLDNSIFGLLSCTISRKLGQITYSIYLVHGLILFIVFHYIIGIEDVSKLIGYEYWGIIAICIFIIVFVCQLTYLYIETPFIKMTDKIIKNNSIKSNLND